MRFRIENFYERIFYAFVPFTVAVAILYTLMVSYAMLEVEDYVIHENLELELANIIQQTKQHREKPALPQTRYLRSYWQSSENLSPELKNLEPGIHEFTGLREENDFNVLVGEVPGINDRVYLVIDETRFSSLARYDDLVDVLLWLIAALVISAGIALATVIARRISEPVTLLAREVANAPENTREFYGAERRDELGQLSRELGRLHRRQMAMVEREVSFTRHASHELRTPLAVIRNSQALLSLMSCEDSRFDRVVGRIGSACERAERLTEAFLFLGREGKKIPAAELILADIVDEILADYREQILDQGLGLECTFPEIPTTVKAYKPLLEVVLDNLIRNAVSYSAETIHLQVHENALTMNNDIAKPLVEPTEEGFGYGLEIVARVSQRCGWKFDHQVGKDKFSVCIEFA